MNELLDKIALQIDPMGAWGNGERVTGGKEREELGERSRDVGWGWGINCNLQSVAMRYSSIKVYFFWCPPFSAENQCTAHPPPQHGGYVCSLQRNTNTQRCQVKCDNGYEHALRPNLYEECGPTTDWIWSFVLNGIQKNDISGFICRGRSRQLSDSSSPIAKAPGSTTIKRRFDAKVSVGSMSNRCRSDIERVKITSMENRAQCYLAKTKNYLRRENKTNKK